MLAVPQPQRELVENSRIVFYFDQGKSVGTYIGPSEKKSDRGKELSYVRWDDGDNVKVQLTPRRRFDGTDVSEMEPGEWAIVRIAVTARRSSARHVLAYMSEAQLDELIFARDHY